MWYVDDWIASKVQQPPLETFLSLLIKDQPLSCIESHFLIIVRDKEERDKMNSTRNVLNIILILCVCLSWGCTDGAQKRENGEILTHTIELSSLFPSSSLPCVLSTRGIIFWANSISGDSLCFSYIHTVDEYVIRMSFYIFVVLIM